MVREGRLNKRQRALRRGAFAEYLAAAFLMVKGYRILEMRYRVKTGEIDIIARRGDLVAFVEVKARQNIDDALSAVSVKNQSRVKAASRTWLSKRNDFSKLSWRYDIVAVRLPFAMQHFPNAF